MVDIMDMEEIFDDLLKIAIPKKFLRDVKVKKLIAEVSDFVEGQQHIACVNCKGYKFKNLNESWNR